MKIFEQSEKLKDLIKGKRLISIEIIDSEQLEQLYHGDIRYIFRVETTYLKGDNEVHLWRCIVDINNNGYAIIFVKYTVAEFNENKIPDPIK